MVKKRNLTCGMLWILLGTMSLFGLGLRFAHAVTVYAKDYGFNASDATLALQTAINSGADTVVVSNLGSKWIVRPITLQSNQTIRFEPGVVVEAMRGQFLGPNDCLFTANQKTNIALEGHGAVFQMHREDYTNPALYSYSQWRHVLYFLSCANVTITDLTLRDSGGDGLFIGSFSGKMPCTNFSVSNVVCDNNYRQGISVTNANTVLIENCLMQNTIGQEPQAGIDFEPDDATMQLVNITLNQCQFRNNNQSAVLIYPQMLNRNSPDISITFNQCTMSSAAGWGIQFSPLYDDGPGGMIAFNDCVIENCLGPGLYVPGKSAYRAQLKFTRCTWRNVGQAAINGFPANPMVVTGDNPTRAPEFGGITFQESVIYDNAARNFFVAFVPSGSQGLANIKGTLSVINPNPIGLQANYGPGAHDIALTISTVVPQTAVPTATWTATAVKTATPTATRTATAVKTATPTATRTATAVKTATPTATWTATAVKTATPAATPTQTPVTQVAVGTVYAKDFGYNTTDATAALQQAIDSGAQTVVISNLGSDWVVRPIRLASQQELIFEAGVQVSAKPGAFQGGTECLFTADNRADIIIRGNGAVFRMRKADYLSPAYPAGQERHVFKLLSCRNITILDLTARDSGGDGLFIGALPGNPPCQNIRVQNVICDNNARQGMGISHVDQLILENCQMNHTAGIAPECGIQFKPAASSQQITRVLVNQCQFSHNQQAGILVSMQNLMGGVSPDVSLSFLGCTVTSAVGWGIQFEPVPGQQGVRGYVEFGSGLIQDVAGPGLVMSAKAAYRLPVYFRQCLWRRVAKSTVAPWPAYPIFLQGDGNSLAPEFGGVIFENSQIDDNPNRRSFLYALAPPTSQGCSNIKGDLTLWNRVGTSAVWGAGAHDIALSVTNALKESSGLVYTLGLSATELMATPSAPWVEEGQRLVYPNPASDQVTFQFAVAQPETIQLDLYSIAGERVRSVEHQATTGQNTIRCEVQNLASGVYLYVLHGPSGLQKGKFCVARK